MKITANESKRYPSAQNHLTFLGTAKHPSGPSTIHHQPFCKEISDSLNQLRDYLRIVLRAAAELNWSK